MDASDELAFLIVGDTAPAAYEDEAEAFEVWRAQTGPPVPVAIARAVWLDLCRAAMAAFDPINQPEVYRLFMERGQPRHVVAASPIDRVWTNDRGILRWNEGGYPALSARLRKGGNAFVRGDVALQSHDAWWMGREQTDLRILLARTGDAIRCTAWWARGGTGGLAGRFETDGEVWPVRLLIRE